MKRDSRRKEKRICFIKLLGLACKNEDSQFESFVKGKDIRKTGHNIVELAVIWLWDDGFDIRGNLYLNTSRLNDQVTRLNHAVGDLQDSTTETPNESLIEIIRQVEEMAREIIRRVAEIERELALISAIRALENLRNLVREARE
ncbi:uncharacterized protein Bfra_010568 [Botrytis fragariae]|uniref:Uncharacterized protein n=1 Tax=Botrytis fragariae TaxID=1964551 RepID=A0A8H6AF29_9HELO|nr:uncharacterized protein Bfra_010568 [Botrytis fragariae]KAF5867593.1 hypothetical protein Bfra_010568 [Botrytis fragariae]